MASRKAADRDPAGNRKSQPDLQSQQQPPSLPPVVAIGASAGGLEALSQLLRHLPTDTGMAFVVIQHLDPHQESMLTEILAKITEMPVQQVQDGMAIAANQIYVIPPNAQMVLRQNELKLTEREKIHGRPMPVDAFFQSLATARGNRAIAVVLSGSDGDGALGVAAIKASGGITFAQELTSAKFPGMPQHAIATGCVDFVLSPSAIAHEITKISRHPYVASSCPIPSKTQPILYETLPTIFELLRAVKDIDFAVYKPATLQRRVLRRMTLHSLERPEDYITYLQSHPEEIEALYQDLLINVTSFFRDPESFQVLESHVFPSLIEGRPTDSPIRIWVPGCSTGEEAYSIAICLLEFLETHKAKFPIQIFATDLNEVAIERARKGFYRQSLMAGVSPERLRRFFVAVEGGYQIGKLVRELCVFAKQNLGSDPPFSQMDLISCRNVLIYLGRSLQKRIIPIFHYALKSSGFLMLGSSETVGEFLDLFTPLGKKQKIYVRQAVSHRPRFDFNPHYQALEKVSPVIHPSDDDPSDLDLQREADRLVLNRYAPAGVIIDDELKILQFRGQTGSYLEPAAGKASFNLLKMAKEGLLLELRTAVHQAKTRSENVRKEGLLIGSGDQTQLVNIEVMPLKALSGRKPYLLVLFEDAARVPPAESGRRHQSRASRPKSTEIEQENTRLTQELAATREYLQSIIEDQDATNQSLQAANEEILSSNEELQSTNEELETTQEELQATNEELHTINEELRSRNAELNQVNNDLQNLLGSINIPILMLDGQLRIRRFTQLAEQAFKVLPTDIGRPFSDIQPNLLIPNLGQLITEVLDTLVVKEQEVQDQSGNWYSLRIRPYRTTENRIDGVVIGLIDIGSLKQSATLLEEARDYANAIIGTVHHPLVVLDGQLRLVLANRCFYETFGYDPQAIEQQGLLEIGGGEWDSPELRSLLQEMLEQDIEFQGCEMPHLAAGGQARVLLLNAHIVRPSTRGQTILLGIEDITERRETEDRIQRSLQEKEVLLREIHHRVKNNLQIVSSLLSLQSNRVSDPRVTEMLQDSQNRVRAMAMVHEILYQSSNFSELNFTEYAQLLVRNLFRSYTIDREAIALRIETEPGIFLHPDKAVLCGLIVNELVTNALKHGLHDEPEGEVFVTLESPSPGLLKLTVGNNGQQLPEDFDLQSLSSVGLNLVISLVEQLKGTLEIEKKGVTIFTIIFAAIA